MQLRISGGGLKGRVIDAPRGNRTHPMSERLRTALFNVLGDITDLTVLDAFAGSGAIGFEAVSRGAAQATLIDNDKRAHDTMQRNIKALRATGKVTLINAPVLSWSSNNSDKLYSLVIADPPFDKLQPATLEALTHHITDSGVFVLNYPANQPIPEMPNTMLLKESKQAGARLLFYKTKKAIAKG